MTREDIIRMAREAGLHIATDHDWMPIIALAYAQKFAELVRAEERERIKWDTIHSCHPECDKPVCVAIRNAVAEEREACIEAARTVGGDAGAEVEKLIRARGQG
jgi:predicted metal-dependent phosphoesterase TrpH